MLSSSNSSFDRRAIGNPTRDVLAETPAQMKGGYGHLALSFPIVWPRGRPLRWLGAGERPIRMMPRRPRRPDAGTKLAILAHGIAGWGLSPGNVPRGVSSTVTTLPEVPDASDGVAGFGWRHRGAEP
ncbi:hypothetical protein GCM10009116_03560 [Brevundimonas basaltis]